MKKVSVTKDGRVRVQTINTEPTLAQQQYKDECDINNIMARYSKTGEFLHLTSKKGIYADFSEIQDYQNSLQTVINAQDAFASLPAKVRAKFQNDPGELLTYIQDPKNYDEAIDLGLIDKPPEQNQNEPNETKSSGKKKEPKTDPES